MALPGYMKIIGSVQGNIDGECDLEGREASIQICGFEHSVKLPTDSRGLPSGRRLHLPMTITKEVDRTSPMLYQALSEGEILSEVVIDWYRYDSLGMEELYYKQVLKDAQIVSINFEVPNVLTTDKNRIGHLEKVSLIYDNIVWSQEIQGIEFEDTFGE